MVINGLGLEGWADRLVKAAGYRGARLVASKGVKALAGHEHEHGHGEGGHGRYDPHAWQDVANVKIYVANIRDALIGVDPANKTAYQQTAENISASSTRSTATSGRPGPTFRNSADG